MLDLTNLTIAHARKLLDSKSLSAEELTKTYLDAIERDNARLNIYLEVFDDALERARSLDADKDSAHTLLSGIPIALKDNMLVEGRLCSSGSKMLEHYRATYTSTVAQKLLDAGSVILGRVNMDEFAMGSSTENSAFGVTSNPIDESRVPGGTSGGSSAAVAANLALAAFGSDTGGSVRQPAAFCGVVGYKPTYGAFSRHGLMAMASSLDQIGPLTKTVEDTEILFDVIRGEDPMDMTSIPEEVWTRSEPKIPTSVKDLKIGVPFNFIEREGIDPDVLASFQKTIGLLKDAGATVENVELPLSPLSLAVYYIVMPAEISSNLARYDGVKYGLHVSGDDGVDDYFKTRARGFGAETRRRIILGTHVLSSGYYDSYYGKARALRDAISRELGEAFEKYHVLAMPTTPSPAFKKGEKTNDPLAMYLSDIFTVPANIAGLPAISVPTDTVSRDGVELPLGFQFMGPRMSDKMIFWAGKLIEQLYGR